MAYFRCSLGGGSGNGAVITVTYGAEFYNQTFVATNNVDTVSVVATSSGTVDIDVPSEGSWVVSCTIGADTYTSDTVVVDLTYSTSLTALPDGSTVTPTDDIQIWLACAGITDKAYTLLSEVLDDTDTYTTLLGDSNACDYMARSTTWASTIVADADAMRLLGMYDYACDALLSDSTWASAIAGSTYFESVLDIKVPKATSDNANILKSGVYNNYYAYYAFDENNSTMFGSQYNSDPKYVGYNFTTPVRINKCKLLLQSDATSTYVTKIKVQGSNDGTNWTDVETKDVSTTTTSIEFGFVNDNAYSRYRAVKGAPLGDGHSIFIYTLQFYGRHTAQTDIIHSAPSDTIYYLDNGSPVTLCTTDANGIGEVDWSDLPTGNITLYSSVAKNPTDLTADYSKTIKVTKNKVEGYLMPDKALYWWGYNVSVETCNTANGWSATSGGASGSFGGTLTYNTNDVSVSVGSNQIQALGSKMSLTNVTLKGILKSTTLNSNAGLTLRKNTSKVVWDNQSALAAQNVANTVELLSANNVTGYVMASCMNSRAGNVYALWYE